MKLALLQVTFVYSHDHHERKLIKHLLENYEPLERPVSRDDEAINVKHGLTLNKISKLCVKEQTLAGIVWMNMKWTDINLQWNPSDYGNIKTIRISPNKIWLPDVVPFQQENMNEVDIHKLTTNVVVQSNGECNWVPPMKLQTTCQIDDPSANDQSCEIKLGSWTYSGNQLNVTLSDSKPDLSSYVPNRKWKITDATAERKEVKYDCCPEKYITLIYTLKLKRQEGMFRRMLGFM